MVIAMKNACGFVDESIRGQQYLMACAVIQARHFSSMRTYLTSTTHGSSLHFNHEPNYRRRAVLADVRRLPLIISVRESSVPLFFEFRIRKREPLLWIPDAVLWAYGAGGDWRDAAMPLVSKVIDVA